MHPKLFNAEQRSRKLLSLIQDMHSFWNDSMSKDMHLRHLSPHEEASYKMLQALDKQYNALDESRQKLKQAELQVKVINEAIAELYKHHKYAKKEMHHAEQEREQSISQESRAHHQIPAIQTLIDHAELVGNQ